MHSSLLSFLTTSTVIRPEKDSYRIEFIPNHPRDPMDFAMGKVGNYSFDRLCKLGRIICFVPLYGRCDSNHICVWREQRNRHVRDATLRFGREDRTIPGRKEAQVGQTHSSLLAASLSSSIRTLWPATKTTSHTQNCIYCFHIHQIYIFFNKPFQVIELIKRYRLILI